VWTDDRHGSFHVFRAYFLCPFKHEASLLTRDLPYVTNNEPSKVPAFFCQYSLDSLRKRGEQYSGDALENRVHRHNEIWRSEVSVGEVHNTGLFREMNSVMCRFDALLHRYINHVLAGGLGLLQYFQTAGRQTVSRRLYETPVHPV
jgi:hypothetical protein